MVSFGLGICGRQSLAACTLVECISDLLVQTARCTGRFCGCENECSEIFFLYYGLRSSPAATSHGLAANGHPAET
jgi:hypothetical protein